MIYSYIPSFIKISSGIQKLTWDDSQTHRPKGDLISIILFLKSKGRRIEMKLTL
jgi:hypothetical protein